NPSGPCSMGCSMLHETPSTTLLKRMLGSWTNSLTTTVLQSPKNSLLTEHGAPSSKNSLMLPHSSSTNSERKLFSTPVCGLQTCQAINMAGLACIQRRNVGDV